MIELLHAQQRVTSCKNCILEFKDIDSGYIRKYSFRDAIVRIENIIIDVISIYGRLVAIDGITKLDIVYGDIKFKNYNNKYQLILPLERFISLQIFYQDDFIEAQDKG